MPHSTLVRGLAPLLLCLVGLASGGTALGASPRLEGDRTLRAVVVVGPVAGLEGRYEQYGEVIAAAAEAHGMAVTRIYHPNATWRRVRNAAQGADLFAYSGHGNGWPSPYPPFQEDTKNGIGLNPTPGETDATKVLYKGADWIRNDIQLAPGAIVILTHLSFASGNASSGMPLPTEDVARQRVDNYTSGFLSVGARAMFHLGSQPGDTIVDALFARHATMDALFHTRFGGNRDGSYASYYGWVGWMPRIFDSERTPGAAVFLDPEEGAGYLRAFTGDLDYTTDAWRDTGGTPDTDPPVLSDVRVQQDPAMIADGPAPAFSPNGDGLADTIEITYTLSEPAYLRTTIRKPDGTVVRSTTTWMEAGAGVTTWDGQRDDGRRVRDGRYDVTLAPTDAAGDPGDRVRRDVLALGALKAPSATPTLFFAADGDALAPASKQQATLARPATIAWQVRDGAGRPVRTVDPVDAARGPVAWTWDGTDDEGAIAPPGVYAVTATATTAAGSYGHRWAVRAMPFHLKGRLTTAPGTTRRLTILSAEPLKGRPALTVRQPGSKAYPVRVVRLGPSRFIADWTARDGAPGAVRLLLTGTDIDGGSQRSVHEGRVR